MKRTTLILASCISSCIGFSQIIYTAAGTGTAGFSGDGGFAKSAKLNAPIDVKVDASGNVYIADNANFRVRKINSLGIISTIVGNGTYGFSGDGGQASAAELRGPGAIALDASGNLYIADIDNNRIRKVTAATGIITTVAGNGTAGFSGDGGQASAAEISVPNSISLDASGNLYISDAGNNRIREVSPSGVISTIAGNGTNGYTGDGGQASAADLELSGIALDASGNIFIACGYFQVVRKITVSTGVITTVAGTGFTCSCVGMGDGWDGYINAGGFSGDGGDATAAELSEPTGIAFDASGNLYIAELYNERVRKVNISGTISTFAGSGSVSSNGYCINCGVPGGYTGDGGSPTSATMHFPQNLAIDASGNCYIVDAFNNAIRAVSANCPANAGPNKTVLNPKLSFCYPGVSAVIGSPSVPNMTYSWSPSTGLTTTTSATVTTTYSLTSSCAIYTVQVSYSLCTTNTSTVQVCAQNYTGSSLCRLEDIEVTNQAASFIAFPNPSNGELTVRLTNKVDYIQVIDITGRLIMEKKDLIAGETKIDLSKYTKGVYFIRTKIGDAIERQKLIIE